MRVIVWLFFCALSQMVFVSCDCGQQRRVPLDFGDSTTRDSSSADSPSPRPDAPVQVGGTEVRVVITADNSYGFGWGYEDRVNTYFGRPRNFCDCAGDIFNCPIGGPPFDMPPVGADGVDIDSTGVGPEEYIVPAADAPDDAFLYIVGWSDRATTQGVIAQFQRAGGAPVYSGTDAWEVCATGVEYDSGNAAQRGGPTLEVINAELTKCNLGTGAQATSSAGWVSSTAAVTANASGRLQVGEANDTPRTSPTAGNEFPIVCPMFRTRVGLDNAARWMWYSPDTRNSFIYSNGTGNWTRQFLIFRLRTESIPIP